MSLFFSFACDDLEDFFRLTKIFKLEACDIKIMFSKGLCKLNKRINLTNNDTSSANFSVFFAETLLTSLLLRKMFLGEKETAIHY